MVLSDRSIKEEIAQGRIVITPLDESCIQPASVDLHLDHRLLVFNTGVYPYVIDPKQPLDGLTRDEEMPKDKDTPYSLQPGEFVLGSTLEHIELPDDLVARLEGKSSLGRIGLLIHSTAGYVDPGWKGHLTLEISSVARMPILLYAGMKISQISFLRLTTPADRPYGHPSLRSKYQGQRGPTRTRSFQDFEAQVPLMSPTAAPAKAKDSRKPSASVYLRQWLRYSRFKGSVKRFAAELGVPIKTAEDWVYRGTNPSGDSRKKLFSLTRLPQFEAETSALSSEEQP